MLAEIAEELVRGVLAKHPKEKSISLLGISASKLEKSAVVQLEFSFGREDEKRRSGTKQGRARWVADGAIDRIRERFGWEAVGYGSLALGISRSVPDEFRQLAEKEL
jgi:DNA polymerase-4